MARKRKEDAECTRERILASALSLFVRKGYEHTTFTEIAARLKMTKGAVYWYFETKEDLLVALTNLALERFQRQIESLMPQGALSFEQVAEMMVRNAVAITSEVRAAAFFKLMKCQIKWTDDDMAAVRKKLLENEHFGPKQAFKVAIENDMRAGRIRKVGAEEVATVAIAIWDGLVQAKIDGFLACDMESTLRNAYVAIGQGLKKNRDLKRVDNRDLKKR